MNGNNNKDDLQCPNLDDSNIDFPSQFIATTPQSIIEGLDVIECINGGGDVQSDDEENFKTPQPRRAVTGNLFSSPQIVPNYGGIFQKTEYN